MKSEYRNAGICGLCGSEIESTSRHDFKECSCGNIFVDGGHDYQRIGYNPERENGKSILWNNVTKKWVPFMKLDTDNG